MEWGGALRQGDPGGGICHSREVLSQIRSVVAYKERTDAGKGKSGQSGLRFPFGRLWAGEFVD